MLVIVLTARGEISDKVEGLKAGADDYMAKPFAEAELLARVEALGRRKSKDLGNSLLQVGGLSLDSIKRRATKDGNTINLSPREFEVLHTFMGEPGRTFSRDELCERVWQREHEYDTRTVEIFIMRLRRKLEGNDGHDVIETVRGVGYRLRPPE
jgi:DNA-binding response OmpR family regulator